MYKILISILWLMLICACVFGQNSPRVQGELDLIITDRDNNFVGDITKDEITFLVDGKEQNIVSLEKQTLPLIYVLAVDSSGSMRSIFKDILNAGKSVVSGNNQNDLTLLMRFISADKIQITEKFSADEKYLHSKLDLFTVEGGQTALIDAIFKSVQIVAGQKGVESKYRRQVVVITDGEDRDSRNTQAQLIELLKKENVQVFFVGLVNELDEERGFVSESPKNASKKFIQKITETSGGIAIYPKKIDRISEIAKQLATLLRTQYVLKFQMPATAKKDAKLEIKLSKNSKKKNLNFAFPRS